MRDLYTKVWIREFGLQFFYPKESCTLFQILIFFTDLLLILSQLKLSRTELQKCTRGILMEDCDHTICPVLSILFSHDSLAF